MPDDDMEVLVVTNQDHIYLAWHEHDKWHSDSATFMAATSVTHWQEVPAPPFN